MTCRLSALNERDAEIARVTDAQLSEADALYNRAGMLEASAVMYDAINPAFAAQKRATAQTCRETAKALAHSATLAQLQGIVR